MLGVPHAWFWLPLLSYDGPQLGHSTPWHVSCLPSSYGCIPSIDASIHAFCSSTPPFQAFLHWLFHDVYQNPYDVPSFWPQGLPVS